MNKYVKVLFTFIVIVLLLIPLVFMNTEEGAVSDVDGSALASMPSKGDAEYTAGVELYLRDRISFGNKLIKTHAELNDRLFDELIDPTYQYGKDGHSFLKIQDNKDYIQYNTQFILMLKKMQDYCESRGTRFYYVLNPDKENVYSRFLPTGVNYDDPWIDRMLLLLDRYDINYIDLREPLVEASYEEAVFNKSIDVEHWNQTGAFYGMKEITDCINKDLPDVKALDKSEYEVSTNVSDKAYASGQTVSDEIPAYLLKASLTDKSDAIRSEIKLDAGNGNLKILQNDSKEASGINKLLVFEDDLYAQFSASRAKETADVGWLNNVDDFVYYYNIFKPDVLVFESAECLMNDQSFPVTNMEEIDPNPMIIKLFPEKNFNRSREALLKKTKKYDSDRSLFLVSKNEIDRICLSRNPANAKYIYIITGSTVYDLIKDEDGLWSADIRHGDIKKGSDVILYIMDEEGKGRYDTITVSDDTSDIDIIPGQKTDNLKPADDNTFMMTTSTEGNAFNKVVLQLFDENMEKYIREIGSTSLIGKSEGIFRHNKKTGTYRIILKGNSNLVDEWISFDIHLKKGQIYHYSFNVDEFTGTNITISDFRISKLRN